MKLALKILLLAQFLVLLTTLITSAIEVHGLLVQKAHMSIVNDLRPNLDHTAHCKSKDDDLENQVVPYESSFSFRFRPRFWGDVLFFCSMEWKNRRPKHFDIYVNPRDHDKCRCYHYYWSIKPGGPCRFNFKTKKYEFCYP